MQQDCDTGFKPVCLLYVDSNSSFCDLLHFHGHVIEKLIFKYSQKCRPKSPTPFRDNVP